MKRSNRRRKEILIRKNEHYRDTEKRRIYGYSWMGLSGNGQF